MGLEVFEVRQINWELFLGHGLHEELALFRYTALDAEHCDIDQAMTYVRRVPWVADGLLDDVDEHRASSEYWQAHYYALAPQRDASGAVIERQPAVLAMADRRAAELGIPGTDANVTPDMLES